MYHSIMNRSLLLDGWRKPRVTKNTLDFVLKASVYIKIVTFVPKTTAAPTTTENWHCTILGKTGKSITKEIQTTKKNLTEWCTLYFEQFQVYNTIPEN